MQGPRVAGDFRPEMSIHPLFLTNSTALEPGCVGRDLYRQHVHRCRLYASARRRRSLAIMSWPNPGQLNGSQCELCPCMHTEWGIRAWLGARFVISHPALEGGGGRGTAGGCSCQRELGLPLRAAALAPASKDARRVARTASALAIPSGSPSPSRARRRRQTTYLREGTRAVAARGLVPSRRGRVQLATP